MKKKNDVRVTSTSWFEDADGKVLAGERPDDIHNSIDSPSHYFFGKYQVRDVLQAWLKDCGLSPDEASDWEKGMEYMFRYHKKGTPAKDIKKAIKYFTWIGERYD